MRLRDVVGKRIVGVRQERWESNSGWIWTVRSFQLEGGVSVVFHVVEGEDQHGIEVSTHRKTARSMLGGPLFLPPDLLEDRTPRRRRQQ